MIALLASSVALDAALRSLHTESEIFGRNYHTLKNKYNLTLCQSRLHTGSGSIFCVFASVACILIGKDGENGKTHAKISDSVCNDLYSRLNHNMEI